MELVIQQFSAALQKSVRAIDFSLNNSSSYTSSHDNTSYLLTILDEVKESIKEIERKRTHDSKTALNVQNILQVVKDIERQYIMVLKILGEPYGLNKEILAFQNENFDPNCGDLCSGLTNAEDIIFQTPQRKSSPCDFLNDADDVESLDPETPKLEDFGLSKSTVDCYGSLNERYSLSP